MERKEFLSKCSTCGTLSLFGLLCHDKINAQENDTREDNPDYEPINKTQIQQLISFINLFLRKSDKESVFRALGMMCFYSRNYDQYLAAFKANPYEYFDQVKRIKPKFWDKLEYDKTKSVITITGKKSTKCNCEYGRGKDPVKVLCTHCCVSLQEVFFRSLLNKEVEVRLDESVLLGNERCSTTIFVY